MIRTSSLHVTSDPGLLIKLRDRYHHMAALLFCEHFMQFFQKLCKSSANINVLSTSLNDIKMNLLVRKYYQCDHSTNTYDEFYRLLDYFIFLDIHLICTSFFQDNSKVGQYDLSIDYYGNVNQLYNVARQFISTHTTLVEQFLQGNNKSLLNPLLDEIKSSIELFTPLPHDNPQIYTNQSKTVTREKHARFSDDPARPPPPTLYRRPTTVKPPQTTEVLDDFMRREPKGHTGRIEEKHAGRSSRNFTDLGPTPNPQTVIDDDMGMLSPLREAMSSNSKKGISVWVSKRRDD